MALSDWLEELGHGHEAGALRFVLHHSDPSGLEALRPRAGRRFASGVFVHRGRPDGTPLLNNESGWYGSDHGITLATPETTVHLIHADPTDKLIEEFRARSTHSTPQSRAYSKRPSIIGDASGSWDARHTALSHLAYHLKTFGNAEVGERLEKLLAKRGHHQVVPVAGMMFSQPSPRVIDGSRTWVAGSTHGVYSSRQKPGAPVRLHKKPSDSFRL